MTVINGTRATRIVLPYDGGVDAGALIGRLLAETGVDEIVTVTVDVGQDRDVEESRDRALAGGAARAHAADGRDAIAEAMLAIVRSGACTPEDVGALDAAVDLVTARKLIEVWRIERAEAIASTSDALTAAIRAEDLSAPIVDIVGVAGVAPHRRHLLHRPVPARLHEPAFAAHVEIAFAGGVPVAINEVGLPLTELFECLSLIAGQHGVGGDAPAAVVLSAAYAALASAGTDTRADAVVRVDLAQGRFHIPSTVSTPSLVNYA